MLGGEFLLVGGTSGGIRRAVRSLRTSRQKAGSGGSRLPATAVAADRQPKLLLRVWQRMLEVVEPPLIVDSARKHGIADEDVLHAFNHPVRYEDLDEGFVMIIGPTRSAQLVELGVLDTDHGPVTVHAMTARRKYLRL